MYDDDRGTPGNPYNYEIRPSSLTSGICAIRASSMDFEAEITNARASGCYRSRPTNNTLGVLHQARLSGRTLDLVFAREKTTVVLVGHHTIGLRALKWIPRNGPSNFSKTFKALPNVSIATLLCSVAFEVTTYHGPISYLVTLLQTRNVRFESDYGI